VTLRPPSLTVVVPSSEAPRSAAKPRGSAIATTSSSRATTIPPIAIT
jgi:hypothetical protein